MNISKALIIFEYIKTKRILSRLNTREDIGRYHSKKVKSLLRKVLPKSKYYSNIYDGLDYNQWEQFPIISKSEWMAYFETLNTVGITLQDAFEVARKGESTRNFKPTIKGITVGLSSGTSGNRGLWLVGPQERYRWVANVLAKLFPNGLLSKERIALFLRANSNLYETIGSARLSFRYYDIHKPFEQLLQELVSYGPTVLMAPPAILLMIANSQALKLKPNKVVSVADVLDEVDARKLEAYFNCKIDQVYMATEGFIALTCKEGTLHVNEDMLIVQEEWIDKETKRYYPIVTDFQRYVQPIIRYRLSDILIQGVGCRCGSPFKTISRIEGRQDDVLYYPNKSGDMVAIFPDFIRNAIISSNENISDYIVIQNDVRTLDVYLDQPKPINLDLRQIFEGKSRVPEIKYYEGIPERKASEKMRRIRRNMDVL